MFNFMEFGLLNFTIGSKVPLMLPMLLKLCYPLRPPLDCKKRPRAMLVFLHFSRH